MSDFKNFDPSRVVLVAAGINIYGFAKGTSIEIEYDEDAFKKETGRDGDMVRVRSHDKGGKVTVTLMASSPCNDLLSARAVLDRKTGLGTGPMLMKDLNKTTVAEAQASWIKKMPKFESGDEASNVVWEFECHDLELYFGGALI